MNCEEIRERIDDLSPGDIQTPGDDVLKAHLDACEGCRAYRDKSMALTKALNCWDIPEPRKNIQAGVMAGIARLEREKSEPQAPGTFWQQLVALFRYRFQVPAMAAASLVLLLGISVALNFVQYGRGPQTDERPTFAAGGGVRGGTIRTVGLEPTPPGRTGFESGSVVVYEPDGERLLNLDPESLSVPVIVILGVPPHFPVESELDRKLERTTPVSHTGEDRI